MTELNQDIKDPSQIGNSGLKGINNVTVTNTPEITLGKNYNLKNDYYTAYNNALNVDNQPQPDPVEEFSNIVNNMPTFLGKQSLAENAYKGIIYDATQALGLTPGYSFEGYGESKYDKPVLKGYEFENLQDFRAKSQPFMTKLGNWAGQLLSTAVISTVGGLLSIPIGLVAGTVNSNGKGFGTNFISNPFTNAMNDAQKAVSESLQIHTTKADEEAPWWKINGRWGNGSAQALGFVLGMLIPSGAATKIVSKTALSTMKAANRSDDFISSFIKLSSKEANAIVNATKKGSDLKTITDLTRQVAQTKKTVDGLSRVVAGGVNASFEATVEALGTYDEIMNDSKYIQTIATLDNALETAKNDLLNDDRYSVTVNSPYGSFKQLNEAGREALTQIENDVKTRKDDLIRIQTDKANNSMKSNYIINSLVVGASNYMLFGRGLVDRFNARKTLLSNISEASGLTIDKTGKKVALTKGLKGVIDGNKAPIIKGLTKSAGSAIREGGEEAAQAFSNSFLRKQSLNDINYKSFTSQVYNPDAIFSNAEQAKSMWENMREAGEETFSGENMIGIVLGAALGIIGMPIRRKPRRTNVEYETNEDGSQKVDAQGKPIVKSTTKDKYKWEFSLHPIEEIKQAKVEKAERELLVDQINERLATIKPEGSTVNEFFNDYFKNSNLKYVTEYNKTNALNGQQKKTFKDEQMTELIADYILFSKLGKRGIESLTSIPEQLANLKTNVSTNEEQKQLDLIYELFGGKEIVTGGQVTNEDGTVINHKGIYNGVSTNEIFADLQRKGKEILEDIKIINKNAVNLKGLVSPQMQEDSFNELVYLASRIDNFKRRDREINSLVKSTIKNTIEDYNQYFNKDIVEAISNYDKGKYSKYRDRSINPELNVITFALNNPEAYLEVLESTLGEGTTLSSTDKNNLKKTLETLSQEKPESVKSGTLQELANDLYSIQRSQARLIELYTGYIENPETLDNDVNEVKQEYSNVVQKAKKESDKRAVRTKKYETLSDYRYGINIYDDEATDAFFRTISDIEDKVAKGEELSEEESTLLELKNESNILDRFINELRASLSSTDFYQSILNRLGSGLLKEHFKRFGQNDFADYKQMVLQEAEKVLIEAGYDLNADNSKSLLNILAIEIDDAYQLATTGQQNESFEFTESQETFLDSETKEVVTNTPLKNNETIKQVDQVEEKTPTPDNNNTTLLGKDKQLTSKEQLKNSTQKADIERRRQEEKVSFYSEGVNTEIKVGGIGEDRIAYSINVNEKVDIADNELGIFNTISLSQEESDKLKNMGNIAGVVNTLKLDDSFIKDAYEIGFTNVFESQRGKGIGEKTIKNIGENLSKNGYTLVSDDSRSDDAEKMWVRLETKGLAKKIPSKIQVEFGNTEIEGLDERARYIYQYIPINAKYDAEIAALERTTTEEITTPTKVNDVTNESPEQIKQKLEEAIPTVEKEDIHKETRRINNSGEPDKPANITNTNIEKEIVGTDTTDNLPDIKSLPRDGTSEYIKDKDTGNPILTSSVKPYSSTGQKAMRNAFVDYFKKKLNNLFYRKDSGQIKLEENQKVYFVIDNDFINYTGTNNEIEPGFSEGFYPIFIATEIDGKLEVIGSLSSSTDQSSMYGEINKTLISQYGTDGKNGTKGKLPTAGLTILEDASGNQYTSTIKQVYPARYLFNKKPKNNSNRSDYYKNVYDIYKQDNEGHSDNTQLKVGKNLFFTYIKEHLDNNVRIGSPIMIIRDEKDKGKFLTTYILTKSPAEVFHDVYTTWTRNTNNPIVNSINSLVDNINSVIKSIPDKNSDKFYKDIQTAITNNLRPIFYLGSNTGASNYHITGKVFSDESGNRLELTYSEFDIAEAKYVEKETIPFSLDDVNLDQSVPAITQWLIDKTLYFNFSHNSNPSYINFLLENGVFTTDLVSLRKKNAWFTLNDLNVVPTKFTSSKDNAYTNPEKDLQPNNTTQKEQSKTKSEDKNTNPIKLSILNKPTIEGIIENPTTTNEALGLEAQITPEQTESINKGEETDNIRSEITKIREELKEPDEVNHLEKYDVVTDGNYNELILKNTSKNTPKYEYYNIDLSKANPNNEITGIYRIRIDTANNTYSIDPVLKDHINNYIDAYESTFNLEGPKNFDKYTIIPGKVKKTNNGYEIIEKGTIYLMKDAKKAANFLQTGTIEPRKSIPFTEINKRLKGALINNGITEKVWDSYDSVEKDKALRNLKFSNKSEQSFVQGKQFQKLTAKEKARTIEQVTKEHRSITALKDLAAKLAHRTGGKVRFENNTDADWKGYNHGMTSVLNEAYMTPDTPFHEILAHPIIRAIKNKHTIKYVETYDGLPFGGPEMSISNELTSLYKSLLKELETGRGREVFEQVKRDYNYKERKFTNHYIGDGFTTEDTLGEIEPFSLEEFKKLPEGIVEKVEQNDYLDITTETINIDGVIYEHTFGEDTTEKVTRRELPKYTLEEQQEEAIVTLLGMMAADKLDAKKDATLISKLKELWKQISDFVRQLLLQDEIKIDELPITTTLNDLAEIMAYGNNKIILPGYKVEYSTPLGNKYETLEEVNNEIRGLADANVEVDLSGISLKLKEPVNNIFEIPVNKFTDEFTNDDFEKRGDVWYYEGTDTVIDNNIIITAWNSNISDNNLSKTGLEGFIEKNKEYAQSKEIIEQWKKENNIQYDPEEVYSRGQGFYSSIGAYSNLELDLLLKNLIPHIQDNKKAEGEFTISAFTKPIDKRLKHIEGTGDRVRFVIYPQSEHIKWAAPTDVYSGSVWDAHEKVSKDKKSELLGVSFTKAPALRNIDEVSPNLADIIDNLSHGHNELGIELTTNNFRIEYDDNIDYSTKKLIDNINKILDDKYGKLEKPEITKKINNKGLKITFTGEAINENGESEGWWVNFENGDSKGFDSKKELNSYINSLQGNYAKQPTQTKENTTSIESVKDRLYNENYDKQLKIYESAQQGIIPEYYSAYTNLNGELSRKIHVFALNLEKTKNEVGMWQKDEDYDIVKDFIVGEDENKYGVKFWVLSNQFKKEALNSYEEPIKGINQDKEHIQQALTNLKVAALKEVARKYPRSLITSKVVLINPNLEDNSEKQYSKRESTENLQNELFESNETLANSEKSITFAKLDESIKKVLLKRGFTESSWNNLSTKVKEHEINCLK